MRSALAIVLAGALPASALGAALPACSSTPGDAAGGPAPIADAGAGAQDVASSDAPGPPPCSGQPGTFHDQPLESGAETRHYWLHVPASYSCASAAPLVVDFHGTGYGGASDPVEESWATPDLESAADDLGFIVVRPRSRSKPADAAGNFYYQWDINPGDVAKNKVFALDLVTDLATRYHVDPSRVYATGFSNGPSMAAQFLADEPSIFHGFGLIAGGLNAPLSRKSPFGADAPRIYSMTGFRDYMLLAKDILDDFLSIHAFPADRRFDRQADTGHEVYGWHFREAFTWMDEGKRPAPGSLRAPWIAESSGATESIVEMTTDPSGAIVAVGANGGVFARESGAPGAWSKRATLDNAPLTDVCFLPSGRGFAAGHGRVATTDDGVTWTASAELPEFGAGGLGYTWATSLGCAGTRVTVGGVWSSATSTDGGATWTAASLGSSDGNAFVSAVRPFEGGWLGLGYYDYVGLSTDGVSFSARRGRGPVQWWNDGVISGSHGLIVGEGGSVRASNDGGSSWSAVTTPTKEDLYAVQIRGANAVAVGAHGAVITSADGGTTWKDASTGLDGFLGAVRFLDDATILVAGEGGTVLRLAL